MIDVMPSLNALRAFDAVAQAKSYKAAAENLRVTPAAVKQLVAKLEAHLGVPLIERQGQGLALTAAGEAGAGRLSEGFAALEQAVGMMVPSTQAQARLVISAEPFSPNRGWFPDCSVFATPIPVSTCSSIHRWR